MSRTPRRPEAAGTPDLESSSRLEPPGDSRRFLETLIGNLPGAVYRCANSPAYPVTYLSEKVAEITGWSSDEFLAREIHLGDLIVEEDRERVWTELQEALSERRPFFLGYGIRSRDGRERWIWDNGCGVFDERGELECIEGVLFDGTRERALENQLLHAQKMEAVGRLAGGVAHDFNNLLTAILGYSDMVSCALPENSAQRKQVLQILHAAQRAANLTRRLLAFARKEIVDPRVFDLNELLLSIDPLLRRLIGEDVELVTLPGSAVGPIEADPGQIEQVLVNLVVNAREAMPEGGRLAIETAEIELAKKSDASGPLAPGRYVLLSVSDTGVGVEQQDLEQIFEPFYTTKEDGTGLGLSTCYGIVTQAGGHIGARSEAGRGTTFHIHLPRAEVERVPAALPSLTGEGRGGSETVLVVEDESLVRQVVHETLSELGYAVLIARSGVEAEEVLAERGAEIDLLVTDMVLPRMSGREVARRLRLALPDLPVLYVSGYSDDLRIATDARDARTGFLAKPFTPRSLGDGVRAILDASRTAQRSSSSGR